MFVNKTSLPFSSLITVVAITVSLNGILLSGNNRILLESICRVSIMLELVSDIYASCPAISYSSLSSFNSPIIDQSIICAYKSSLINRHLPILLEALERIYLICFTGFLLKMRLKTFEYKCYLILAVDFIVLIFSVSAKNIMFLPLIS